MIQPLHIAIYAILFVVWGLNSTAPHNDTSFVYCRVCSIVCVVGYTRQRHIMIQTLHIVMYAVLFVVCVKLDNAT